MKSAVETLEPTRVKLTVEAPYDEVASDVDAAYREVAGQVNIPGFRRGKVPARVIDQRVGRGVVVEQAVNAAVPRLYREALVENDLKALGQPEIDVTEVPALTGPLGGAVVFTAEVDVRPEIVLPAMSSITLSVEGGSVTDDDVEERLTSLRERFGSLVTVDRPVVDGDFVVIDLVADVDGTEVESVSGVSYQVGSASMIEGLDEALTGTRAGDAATFTTRLAAGDHAGEEAQVTVTATEVKERELPTADDDFAQVASEFDTIEELREDLRGAVQSDRIANQSMAARDALLAHLRENVDFPLPSRVVDSEIAAHLEREGKDADDPHGAEVREDTERMLREQLILDELSEQYKVQVGQEELLQFLFSAAQQYGVEPSQFIQAADRNGQIPAFVGEVARNKSLALALRRVTVTDEAGATLDLTEYVGEDTEDEASAVNAAEEAAATAKAPATKAATKKAPAKKAAPKKAPAKKAPTKKAADEEAASTPSE